MSNFMALAGENLTYVVIVGHYRKYLREVHVEVWIAGEKGIIRGKRYEAEWEVELTMEMWL